jgi:hypothetical protein
MLSGLKTSAVVLAGLLLGFLASLPLAWYGVRHGADALATNVAQAVAAVEGRQQAMADQALRLQPMLARFGVTRDPDLFEAVQEQRSRLAGEASLREKLERVQTLEEALLRVERLTEQSAASDARLGRQEAFSEDRRIWEKQKRLLVREQYAVQDRVAELNGLLGRWPASELLAYRTFGALVRGLFGDVFGNVAYLGRLSLDWVGYWARRAAALRGQQAPPDPPKWQRPAPEMAEAYLLPLNRPVFLADAPLPEDEYHEVQFTHQVKDKLADVELGDDEAVLENRHAPAGYEAPTTKPQKTVTYSGAN